MLETGWTREYVLGLRIDLIASLYFRLKEREIGRMGLLPSAGIGTGAGIDNSKWKTDRFETRIGAGRKRTTTRVNFDDLFDHPELLGAATTPR
jgi:hypothetical protein